MSEKGPFPLYHCGLGLFVTETYLTNTDGKIIDVIWKDRQDFDRKI